MQYQRLTDAQWNVVSREIPAERRQGRGRPRASNRQTLDAILYIMLTGQHWQTLPREYGSPSTAFRRYKEWVRSGAWRRIWSRYFITVAFAGVDGPDGDEGSGKQLHGWVTALALGRVVPIKHGTRVTTPSWPPFA